MVAPPERKHSVWMRIHIVLLLHISVLSSLFFSQLLYFSDCIELAVSNKKKREFVLSKLNADGALGDSRCE